MNRIQEILASSLIGVPLEAQLAARVQDRAQYKAQLAGLNWPKNRDKRAISVLEFYQENEKEIIRVSVALSRNVPRDDAPPAEARSAEETAKAAGLDLQAQKDKLAQTIKDATAALDAIDHGGPAG